MEGGTSHQEWSSKDRSTNRGGSGWVSRVRKLRGRSLNGCRSIAKEKGKVASRTLVREPFMCKARIEKATMFIYTLISQSFLFSADGKHLSCLFFPLDHPPSWVDRFRDNRRSKEAENVRPHSLGCHGDAVSLLLDCCPVYYCCLLFWFAQTPAERSAFASLGDVCACLQR